MQETKIGEVKRIGDIETSLEEGWSIESDSQDAESVREHLLGEWVCAKRFEKPSPLPYYFNRLTPKTMKETLDDFDSFLVKVNEGDYEEVWGFKGIVAFNDKDATRLW